jgi:Fe-S-cluster-containing hydrogenase component 2
VRNLYRPLTSLQAGCWFKLICGASYQHLPSIRCLALAYALAGADCIDVAADPAVVEAVKEAFAAISWLRQAQELTGQIPFAIPPERPLLMVSFSDGEDPHFRKASFDPDRCPPDCSRPCERICPAAAIAFDQTPGVIEERCYGCGRCLPVCPIQQIETITHATSVEALAPTLLSQVDAIEIHTQVGRYDEFMALWSAIRPHVDSLSLISISCPDHAGVSDYLWQLYEGLQPLSLPLIWQTDGRPMSGDIGKGTTHATLRYAQKVLQTGPPGFVQLAGGTNAHTVGKLGQLSTQNNDPSVTAKPRHPSRAGIALPTFGGVAYGSFARSLLSSWLENLPPWASLAASTTETTFRPFIDALEPSVTFAYQLLPAVQLAQSLVMPLQANRRASLTPPIPVGHSWLGLKTHQELPSLSSFE